MNKNLIVYTFCIAIYIGNMNFVQEKNVRKDTPLASKLELSFLTSNCVIDINNSFTKTSFLKDFKIASNPKAF